MTRVQKLRGAVSKSSLPTPEKKMLTGAIDKCRAHGPHKVTEKAIEPLLAFGARRPGTFTSDHESEFRLYARLAVCLLGYISFPSQMEQAKGLRAELDRKYNDVAFAKLQYNKYKNIALAIHSLAPAAIVDIEDFVSKVNLSADLVSDRINKAVTVGIESIKRLKSNSRSINFGNKYSQDDLTKPSSKLGREYIANDVQIGIVKDVTAKNTALKRRKWSMDKILDAWKYADAKSTLASVAAEFAQDAKDMNVSDVQHLSKEQYTDELLEHMETFGFRRTETVAESKSRLVAANAQYDRDKKVLVDGQGDLALMEVTAFGAFVHELTHMVLDTEDVDSTCIEVPGQQVYGPLLCQMLAAKDATLALGNADNYRHFVECWVD